MPKIEVGLPMLREFSTCMHGTTTPCHHRLFIARDVAWEKIKIKKAARCSG
jgi:hypothetical protein